MNYLLLYFAISTSIICFFSGLEHILNSVFRKKDKSIEIVLILSSLLTSILWAYYFTF